MSEPTLRQLAAAVTLDVNRTLGGGNPAIELLRRRFVGKHWLDAAAHALFIAVSRVTPGTNVLAYCVAIGWRFHGWPGALIALAAGSIPGSVTVVVLAVTLGEIDGYAVVRLLLACGTLAASALVLWSAWVLLRPYLSGSRLRVTLIAGAAAGLMMAGATPVRVLLVAAVVSAALPVSAMAMERWVSGTESSKR
jgi:chromate transporter